MDVVTLDTEITQGKGEDFVQEVVVVAPQVNNLSVILGNPLHDEFEKLGVLAFPTSGFLQLPPVYYVAVEEERIAGMGFEEFHHFFDPRILDAQVQVG
jgi:hypothetical protein